MFATVVDGLDPGGEQGVQLHQVVELAAGADLDQKLLPNGAEYPLDLAATFRLSGSGVDQPDPQRRASSQQLLVDERRPVVHIDRGRDPPGRETAMQRSLEPDGVFAAGPPIAGQQPGM